MRGDGAGPVALCDQLTLALAERLCIAALGEATAAGFAAAVAVVDAGGHLVAFRRDDHAAFITATVAQRKAWTAASSHLPTEVWNTLSTDPEVAPILHATGLLAVAGGVPVIADGRVVGGLGLSGGTAAQDHQAAVGAVTACVGTAS